MLRGESEHKSKEKSTPCFETLLKKIWCQLVSGRTDGNNSVSMHRGNQVDYTTCVFGLQMAVKIKRNCISQDEEYT